LILIVLLTPGSDDNSGLDAKTHYEFTW